MPGVRLDLSEVRKAAADFGAHALAARAEAEKVVNKGALNIKNQLRSEAKGHRMAPGLPAAITYDVKVTSGATLAAEIGPVEGKAGSLAFYYYGNSHTGPVLKDPAFALDKEMPNVERYLAQIPDLL